MAAQPAPWSLEWKEQELKKLRKDWSICTRCQLCKTRTNVVFGEGYADADIMLIGEAPGEKEDEEGKPFVGPSGSLLNSMMVASNVDRDDMYITNIVLCRPPDNRDPIKDEREACYERLVEQIYIVDPMLIIAVGLSAFKALTKKNLSMDAVNGKLFTAEIPGRMREHGKGKPHYDVGQTGKYAKPGVQYDVMPIYHPAFILRYDQPNPKTGRYKERGPAHKTQHNLARARLVTDLLHKEYMDIRDTLRGT